MGRWKANNDNSPYYDPNDSGPNQVGVPEGYNPDGTKKQAAPTPPPTTPPPANGGQRPPTNPHLQPGYNDQPTEYANHNDTNQPYVDPNSQPPQNSSYDNSGIGAGATQPPATTPPSYSYMEGVDINKLNNPAHTTPKYVASRILASGGSLADAAKAVGATVLDEDKMQLPTGEIIDTRRDIEGANQLQWLVTHDPAWATDNRSGNGKSKVGTGGGDPKLGTVGTGTKLGANSPNDLWSLLMQRAGQGLNVDPTDPIISAQVNAYRAEQERGVRNNIADQAEAQGPNANLTLERRVANEKAAQATGGLKAQLMQNELTARRSEIQQALSQMGSLLSDQQKIALQRELGMIDSSLRQQQITNQNNQFLDSFGLNVTDRANYWDALRSGLLKG